MSFSVDTSPQPDGHPPLSPADGSVSIKNPPALIWRVDERAVTYVVELCQDPSFAGEVVRRTGIDMPFYNADVELSEGVWYWRYFVVSVDGEQSDPGSVCSFQITPESVLLPVLPTETIFANMPDHPRVFVTPDTLEEFRARKDGPAKEAWEHLKFRVDSLLDVQPPEPDLQPVPQDLGEQRGQVFHLEGGELTYPADYQVARLTKDADNVNALSFAYLITGDEIYADAARRWMGFVSKFRIDSHLEDRGQHDTVVYCYEYGLKGMALAYDRLYDLLSSEEREKVLGHIEYHCEAAYQWIHDNRQIHLDYQNSHGQQCMHALLTTVLAVATESDRTKKWADYLIRQYVNRVAWGSNDGGYTEGQKYGHKVQFILEALAAFKTATGLDLFREPRWRNTGDFWLYCMSLNYWWNHWGDCYSLIDPNFGSDADTYVAAFLASMTGNQTVKWWSDTRVCSPVHLPLWYLSGSGIQARPPVDIPQGRLFPEVGQLAAFDRFYDHGSNRIFFRSSPWGGHSHAHSDQNGFVLHAGGEILACDAGYYTYSGDTYHNQWSRTTHTHNSILVNGEGQPKGIAASGHVPAFFNTPEYCVFTGDAAMAYEPRLQRFDRHVLFVRPDVWIVCDDLRANEPADFTWVLNTFEAVEIDSDAKKMTVRQQDQRLSVQHLVPRDLSYRQNNDRPYPMKTRSFCRFTEAFPQQWNICLTPSEKESQTQFLAVLHAYNQVEGTRIRNVRRLEADNALGVVFEDEDGTESTFFRFEPDAAVQADGIRASAKIITLRTESSQLRRWLVQASTELALDNRVLFQGSVACDVAASFALSSAAAQFHIQNDSALNVSLWLPEAPSAIFQAPPNRPQEARSVPFTWTGAAVQLELTHPRKMVFWVDPVFDLIQVPEVLQVTVTDGEGDQVVSLETAVADNGELISFSELMPREPGVYEFVAENAEFLVQDHWDPDLSVRGKGRVVAPMREGTELFIRYAAGQVPVVRVCLAESFKGKLVNLLCNGSFEAGIPEYPPRYWNVQHPRTDDPGWPGWSVEGAAQGSGCLRFVRPKDSISLKSRPMRLRTAGRYVLRFDAKGDATHASVSVAGQLGTGVKVAIEPSSVWREYCVELDVQSGYATVSVGFDEGGEADQVLWVDDVGFGYIG
ncbi:MAG: DUF4962 domain-containing protein [bacterium]|nr:DUF4962 domain-containing protein [bacterium]